MGVLSDIIRSVLVFFHSISTSWGIAIILLTLAMRVILFPLYLKQNQMLQSQKDLQPKQKELQEKYKDKPEEYQKRLLELYKEHKVNPFGSCLPMFLQFPILIALFNVLRGFDFGGSSFLWMPNLGTPDPYYILPILSAVSTWYQMKLTTTDQSQQTMVLIMPLFIGWMSIKFPAGLNIYWAVGNVFSVAQQLYMNYRYRLAKEAQSE